MNKNDLLIFPKDNLIKKQKLLLYKTDRKYQIDIQKIKMFN